ncbi:MAG: DUF4296 domain-containing protein [Bacteroidales bacterium]|nr:DUF4296 domain-containing protein [Bacteroidales bacterium]
MKRYSHILFMIIAAAMMVLSGCNDKKKVMKKPPHLINRITLVNILAESYLIESTLQMTVPDTIRKEELARRYYKDLFDRYKITNEQFESSVAYYVSEEKSAEKLLSDASALIVNKKNELMIDDPNLTAAPDTQTVNP